MRRAVNILVVTFCIAMWSTSVFAAEGATTGKGLQSLCKIGQGEEGIGFPRTPQDVLVLEAAYACRAYIAALADLMLLPHTSDQLHLCLPKEITMDQLKANITGMVLDLPKELQDYSAAVGIIALLRMDAVASQRNCRALSSK